MSLSSRYTSVTQSVQRACEKAGRQTSDVCLIAVSKTYPVEAIQELYDFGHRDFGESRVQEALPKIEALPNDIRWHFIGNLQSNKARRAAMVFDIIHTLSSESQLKEIAKAPRQIEGFIEVNIAEEEQKGGISAKSLDEFAQVVLHYPNIRLQGLMTVGPDLGDPARMRPYFRELRQLALRLGLPSLSMGMSNDFDVAIQEGATHIRVGSAIFGSRG